MTFRRNEKNCKGGSCIRALPPGRQLPGLVAACHFWVGGPLSWEEPPQDGPDCQCVIPSHFSTIDLWGRGIQQPI